LEYRNIYAYNNNKKGVLIWKIEKMS
jgi:hypothetical protein